MTRGPRLKALCVTVACAGAAMAATLLGSPRGKADDRDDRDDKGDPRIEQGFDIAPVPLKFEKVDRKLVGLGSYIVNTEGCNDCHSAGPTTEYARGGDPYFGQPKKVNTATYLGGGRDFMTVAGPPSPHIISRNLTPTPSTGLPGGDITLERFFEIIRHGTDFDQLHPDCSAAVTTFCFPQNPLTPPVVDGNLLQVMPWPNFKDLTDHEVRAVYEYLKAVPCIQGNYPGPGGPAANIPPEPADRCQ